MIAHKYHLKKHNGRNWSPKYVRLKKRGLEYDCDSIDAG